MNSISRKYDKFVSSPEVRTRLSQLGRKLKDKYLPKGYSQAMSKLKILNTLQYYKLLPDIAPNLDSNFPLYIKPDELSERQTEVTYLYSLGLSINQIKDILKIKPHSVRIHLSKANVKAYSNDNSSIYSIPECTYEIAPINDTDSYTLLALAYTRVITAPVFPDSESKIPFFARSINEIEYTYYGFLRDQIFNPDLMICN